MEKFHTFTAHLGEKSDKRYQELQRLEMIVNLNLMEKVESIYDLIPFKNRITLLNADWKQALNDLPKNILENSVIYCDPPYQDAKEYQFGRGFDYIGFWQWFRNCPYPVYVSSYMAPSDIKPINFETKIQLLDNGHRGDKKPKKVVNENIYWNGKGGESKTLLDILFGK
jgi:site-specific DNA-adenine methylase